MDIVLDGRRLESAWWGPKPEDAPTLVLLHEGLGSVGLWRDIRGALAEATGCGVFAYSRFGYGQSSPAPLPWPMDYMHREAQDVLPRVLDAAGVRRAVMIGHSDGGSIAAIHAGGTADPRVAGLVLIAAHFFVEDMNIAAIQQIRGTYDQGDLRVRLARHHRNVDNAFHGWNGAWLDPRFRAFDITGFLPRITVPVLGLQGSDDPYGSGAQLRVLRQGMRAPVTTRLIPDAKHAPHLENRPVTLAAIADFARLRLRETTA